jgi:hypothetical protein
MLLKRDNRDTPSKAMTLWELWGKFVYRNPKTAGTVTPRNRDSAPDTLELSRFQKPSVPVVLVKSITFVTINQVDSML